MMVCKTENATLVNIIRLSMPPNAFLVRLVLIAKPKQLVDSTMTTVFAQQVNNVGQAFQITYRLQTVQLVGYQ